MEAPESLGHVKGKWASVGVRDDGGVSTHAEESSEKPACHGCSFPGNVGSEALAARSLSSEMPGGPRISGAFPGHAPALIPPLSHAPASGPLGRIAAMESPASPSRLT